MPVTTDAERRRLEEAGARLEYEDSPKQGAVLERWVGVDAGLVLLQDRGQASVAYAWARNPDTLLHWLLAWRAPHLLDAEAEIARLRVEVERLRAATTGLLSKFNTKHWPTIVVAVEKRWVIGSVDDETRDAIIGAQRALRGETTPSLPPQVPADMADITEAHGGDAT